MEPEKIQEPEETGNRWETYNSRESIEEWEKQMFVSDNQELAQQLKPKKRGRPRKYRPVVAAKKITNSRSLYQKLRRLLHD